jgi:hypothetical protein
MSLQYKYLFMLFFFIPCIFVEIGYFVLNIDYTNMHIFHYGFILSILIIVITKILKN